MGSLGKSSDFLPRSEVEKTLYNRRKPVILLALVMLLLFFIVGIVIEGIAIAYAAWAIQPLQIDQAKYSAAQKLNTELSQRFGQLKLARPNNISVITVLAAVTTAKPPEVNLSAINIGADKTVITGFTGDLNAANKYCNAINIPGKKAQLDTVKENNKAGNVQEAGSLAKDIRFTISILGKDKGGGTK